jgi:hypothetical protein
MVHCLWKDDERHNDGDSCVAGYRCGHAVQNRILPKGEERADTLMYIRYMALSVAAGGKCRRTHAKYIKCDGTEDTKEGQLGRISAHKSKEE